MKIKQYYKIDITKVGNVVPLVDGMYIILKVKNNLVQALYISDGNINMTAFFSEKFLPLQYTKTML